MMLDLLVLACLAIAAITALYYIATHSLVRTSHYIVSSIKELTEGVLEIKLKPKDHPLQFLPGQYIYISFDCKGIPNEEHPFGIISDPTDETLTLDIKALGDFTSKLKDLKVGSCAYIKGPYGNFLNTSNRHHIWIAGGMGIAPFLGTLQSARKRNMSVDLYYVVHSKEETIHLKDILKIAKENPHFRVKVFDSSKEGHITAAYVQKHSKNLKIKDIFLCGPPQMEESLEKQFLELQVPQDKIHRQVV